MNAYRFRLPLKRSLTLKGQTIDVREGVLLQRDGQWAEASPLPGFSPDTIDDVIAALREERTATPSLNFALESLDAPFQQAIAVPMNGLLQGDPQSVLEKAESLNGTAIRAVKLKVGRASIADEISLVRLVRERLRAEISLRLDANQAWTLEQAIAFVDTTKDVDLEYIEEPLQRAAELETLFARTGCRYALDETLLTHEPLENYPNAAALICKPTFLGGRSSIDRLIATEKPIVFTAAFESGIGTARVAQLAYEVSPEIPAGLDTLSWFERDILMEPIEIRGGNCVVPHSLQVDPQYLEKIEL